MALEKQATFDALGLAQQMASNLDNRSLVSMLISMLEHAKIRREQGDASERTAREQAITDLQNQIDVIAQNNNLLGSGEEQRVIELINQYVQDPSFVEALFVNVDGQKLGLFDAVKTLISSNIEIASREASWNDDKHLTGVKWIDVDGTEYPFSVSAPAEAEGRPGVFVCTGNGQINGLPASFSFEYRQEILNYDYDGAAFSRTERTVLVENNPRFVMSFALYTGDEVIGNGGVIGNDEGAGDGSGGGAADEP